ncbi:Uncharacterised protein [Mycobacteroides abscessus subsp. bolletii]|uniref:helix-turn-helix domain-containing protein n=1 Tax=Mycobacteroides abscessus TaxID=36809 RepID=UPI0009C69882|nr:helix-turn-helix domain-containing protein [Mycobacteroides abscessus]SLF30391.1 Uncharacterised protein [Mycobacteroides abscessus subsp. bolletii]
MSEVAAVDEHEVVQPLSREDAEQLDKRIRLAAGQFVADWVKFQGLIDDARRGQVHLTLGYPSWTAYVAEVGQDLLSLPTANAEVRHEVLEWLSSTGMSLRAIAQVAGLSKSTVGRELSAVPSGTPADSAGSDPNTARDNIAASTNAHPDQSAVPNGTPAEEQKTVGLDGKEYRKPKPRKKPEPKPVDEKPADAAPAARAVQIPTAYREIVGGFTRPIEDLFALTRDPRWAKAVQRFNLKDRDTLDRTIDGLQEFRAAMNKQPEEKNPPTPTAEVEEVATTSVPVEPEVVQQVTATPTPARPTNCDRCNVDLPASATEPLCDDCDGAPEAPAPDATVEPPAVVVHNEAISKRSHQRRRFSGRKVTA